MATLNRAGSKAISRAVESMANIVSPKGFYLPLSSKIGLLAEEASGNPLALGAFAMGGLSLAKKIAKTAPLDNS